MRKLLIIFFALAGPIICNADKLDKNSGYLVHGVGTTLCEEVLIFKDDEEKKKFEFVLRVWLGGYFTSLNSVLLDTGEGFSGKEASTAVREVYDVCSNPKNQDISVAEIIDIYWRKVLVKRAEKK